MKNSSLFMLLMGSSFLNLDVKAMDVFQGDDAIMEGGQSSLVVPSTKEKGKNDSTYQFELIGEIENLAQGKPRARFRIFSSQNDPNICDIYDLDLQGIEYGFEKSLPLQIETLDPSDSLPLDLGYIKEKIRFKVNYDGSHNVEHTFPKQYPLYGIWTFQEDRDNTQNIATLKLSAFLNDQWREVDERQVEIQHRLLRNDPEVLGKYYFNGNTVWQGRTILQHYENPKTFHQYSRKKSKQDAEILTHKGNQIIYVEPFAIGNDPSKPKDAYIGEYEFDRNVADHESLAGRETDRLIYSDGKHIYLPHITQELWKQDQLRVGFFIASYKADRRINFISQASISNGLPKEGLYHLQFIKTEGNAPHNVNHKMNCIEVWKKLGDQSEDLSEIDITLPSGKSSIPGMGITAPHHVPLNHATSDVVKLQNSIQEILRRTEEAMNSHQGAPAVIIIGDSHSGKTSLLHALAGKLLIAKKDEEEGGLILTSSPDSLPGARISHGIGSGTQFPYSWYDQVNKIIFWDCPGFEDSKGPQENIIKAFSIQKLFSQHKRVKVLIAMAESSLKDMVFLNALEKLAIAFPEDGQFQKSLTLVVTKQRDNNPHKVLSRILRDVKAGKAQLTPRATKLLEFFANPNNSKQITSFPFPKSEGQFNENYQTIWDSIPMLSMSKNQKSSLRLILLQ